MRTFSVGDRVFAVNPGSFWQAAYSPVFTLVDGVPTCKVDPPKKYWMELKSIGTHSVSYDSFVIDPDGIIRQCLVGKFCSIEALTKDMDQGSLVSVDPNPTIPCTYTFCAEL